MIEELLLCVNIGTSISFLYCVYKDKYYMLPYSKKNLCYLIQIHVSFLLNFLRVKWLVLPAG